MDKKRLVVDFLARWKIVAPLVFFKSVRNLFSANTRIEDIVNSELREELATHNLNEVIAENRELIKIKFSADYVVNQRLNIKAFYDRAITNPFISTTFPSSITNVGFSLRFTLAG